MMSVLSLWLYVDGLKGNDLAVGECRTDDGLRLKTCISSSDMLSSQPLINSVSDAKGSNDLQQMTIDSLIKMIPQTRTGPYEDDSMQMIHAPHGRYRLREQILVSS
jgi:hypothetical protein